MVYVVTHPDWDWNEIIGMFGSLKDAKEAVEKQCAVEWTTATHDPNIAAIAILEGLRDEHVYIYGFEIGYFDPKAIDRLYDIFDEDGRYA